MKKRRYIWRLFLRRIKEYFIFLKKFDGKKCIYRSKWRKFCSKKMKFKRKNEREWLLLIFNIILLLSVCFFLWCFNKYKRNSLCSSFMYCMCIRFIQFKRLWVYLSIWWWIKNPVWSECSFDIGTSFNK